MEIGVSLSYNTLICMEDMKRKFKQFFSEFWSIWRVLGIVSLELKHTASCMIAQNLLDLGYFYQPSNLHHAIDIVVMLCMIIYESGIWKNYANVS